MSSVGGHGVGFSCDAASLNNLRIPPVAVCAAQTPPKPAPAKARTKEIGVVAKVIIGGGLKALGGHGGAVVRARRLCLRLKQAQVLVLLALHLQPLHRGALKSERMQMCHVSLLPSKHASKRCKAQLQTRPANMAAHCESSTWHSQPSWHVQTSPMHSCATDALHAWPMRASHLPFWCRVTPRNLLLKLCPPLPRRRSAATSSSLLTCTPRPWHGLAQTLEANASAPFKKLEPTSCCAPA